MSKWVANVCLLLAVCAGVLSAQGLVLPNAMVGVPYTYDYFSTSESQQILAELQAAQAQLQQEGITLTFSFSVTAGTLPPGLSVANGFFSVSGTPTTPGTYNFTASFNFQLSFNGQTESESDPLPFTLTVTGSTGPALSISPVALSFPLAQASTTPVSQSVQISNIGQQTQTATVSVSTKSGVSGWLSASGGGAVAPFASSSVLVTVNPNGLPAGTYTGTVSIVLSPAGQTSTVAVTATVSSTQQQIEVTQSGLRFQAEVGGGTPASQTIQVLNGGAGSLNFSVTASTLLGGSGWLSVSPSAGTANSTTPAALAVSVNPAGLVEGDYYGQIQISSPGVDNSPQTATVVLNVAGSGEDLGAFVSKTGLIFVGRAGNTNPAAQTITITNPSTLSLKFSTSSSFEQGSNWFTVQPANGSVNSASPAQLSVQPAISGLAAGVYFGQITLVFSDNSTNQIAVVLVVVPAGSTAGIEARNAPMVTSGCTPTKLVPVFTQLGQSFTTVAAWPTNVEVAVVDDCGNFLTAGTVVASFSSGDPPLSLASLQDGRWSATWQPRASATQVTITANAQETSPSISGAASIGGALASNPTTPVISAGGAVSAASYVANQPLAPGGFVSIFGSHLSSGLNQSPTLPLATQLGATQALLAGEALPLQFAANGQINAIVPYDVPANATQQLVVINGPAYSMPELVIVASAQPAVFTADLTGAGAGIIVDVQPDGSQFVVSSSSPASAGDAIVIYCAGLGAVSPSVMAGSAASLTQLSYTVNPVTVTIGGQSAQVLFAGLAPGYAGLYQVNAIVPSGITPASDVPLVLTSAGQASAPVTIALQ
jgi:uncharacterized protein (TIGR03437 family)